MYERQLDNSDNEDFSDGGDAVLTISNMKSKPFEEWILDSTCLFHMCPSRAWFKLYEVVK